MDRAIGELVQWLQMGGYAGFVWSAYGVAAIVLGGLALAACWRHRRSEADLARLSGDSGE